MTAHDGIRGECQTGAHDMDLRTLPFGIEIETIGQTREHLARALAGVLGGAAASAAGGGDTWEVADAQGRTWRLVRDGSLSDPERQAEIVSPILGWHDLELLQHVVRTLRAAGARVDDSTAIHYARTVVMRSPGRGGGRQGAILVADCA
jgi:hypothetical protein